MSRRIKWESWVATLRLRWSYGSSALQGWTCVCSNGNHFLEPIRGRVAVAAGWTRYSRCPSPQQRSPAPPGGSQGAPRPEEMCDPSSKLGLPRCLLPVGRAQINLQGEEAPRRHPYQMLEPPQLAPLQAKGAAALLRAPTSIGSVPRSPRRIDTVQ